MFFAIAMIAATAASVGTTIGTSVAAQKQADKAVGDQKKYMLLNAYVDYGQSLNNAPGAIPTS